MSYILLCLKGLSSVYAHVKYQGLGSEARFIRIYTVFLNEYMDVGIFSKTRA